MAKKIYYFVPIFVVSFIFVTILTPIITMSEDISTKVFRLHILANSDAQYDQDLKLLIRDAVLDETESLFKGCSSVNDAVKACKNNISYFQDIAQEVINAQGYNYSALAYVTKEYFDTREYDGFTLPAGIYDSLKIIIGEGKGHNWWCVMFPAVCISGCTDEFSGYLSDDELNMIKSDDYIIRFKAVELYEKIKSKI